MGQQIRERRSAPRHKVRIPCSVLAISFDPGKTADERPATLGYTHDVSIKSISVVLPSNPIYSPDKTELGTMSEITLALPQGYVRLDGSLLRHAEANAKENLFAFKVEGGTETDRRLYEEYLESLFHEQTLMPHTD